MKIHGLPEKFWLVLSPSLTSTLADICFECDFERYALQIRGGLDEPEIIAVFANEEPAIETAKELLQKVEEFRKTPGIRTHKSPWPNWYGTQESSGGVFICNKETDEKLLIEPPAEWGRNWAWNFTEDGSGIVLRQTRG